MSAPTLIRYEREGDLVHLTVEGVTNHELREVLLGLWCRLESADRLDHLLALAHYQTDPTAWLSPIARAVKSRPGEAGVIDLEALANDGARERP